MEKIGGYEVNTDVVNRDYKYYIFDWDDNILHMPTHIRLERKLPDGTWVPHDVSTALFSIVRQDSENYRPRNNNWDDAYIEFRDNKSGDPAARFMHDTEKAIERVLGGSEMPGPSFKTFRETLIDGRIFAIVTARGHSPQTLRRGVEMFIQRMLTEDERRTMFANLRGYRHCFDGVVNFGTDEQELDFFMNLNRYHAVTSPQFMKWMDDLSLPGSSSEERKQFAINDFVQHITRVLERTPQGVSWRPLSIGFSDDDPMNVKKVQEFIENELSRRFKDVKFVVYDTSDPNLEKGRKVTVAGQLDLGLDM